MNYSSKRSRSRRSAVARGDFPDEIFRGAGEVFRVPHPLLAKGARHGHRPTQNLLESIRLAPSRTLSVRKSAAPGKPKPRHSHTGRIACATQTARARRASFHAPLTHRQDCLFYLNRPRGTGNPACVAAPAADAVAFLSHQQNSRSNFSASPHHAPFLKKGCGTRKS